MTPEILKMASNYLISDLVLPVMRIRAWSELLAFCLMQFQDYFSSLRHDMHVSVLWHPEDGTTE